VIVIDRTNDERVALRRFGVDELDLEDVFVDLVGEGRR
jgi:hypothetical protein